MPREKTSYNLTVNGRNRGSAEEARIESSYRGKEVTIFKNGDVHDPGIGVRVSRKAFPKWNSFLEYLNKRISLTSGPIYAVVTKDGDAVREINQMEDGSEYVAITDKFMQIDYGRVNNKNWDITPRFPQKDPSPLFSTESETIIDQKMEKKLKKIKRVKTGFDLRARSNSPPQSSRYPKPTTEPRTSVRSTGKGNDRAYGLGKTTDSPFYSSKSQPSKFAPRRNNVPKGQTNKGANFYAKQQPTKSRIPQRGKFRSDSDPSVYQVRKQYLQPVKGAGSNGSRSRGNSNSRRSSPEKSPRKGRSNSRRRSPTPSDSDSYSSESDDDSRKSRGNYRRSRKNSKQRSKSRDRSRQRSPDKKHKSLSPVKTARSQRKAKSKSRSPSPVRSARTTRSEKSTKTSSKYSKRSPSPAESEKSTKSEKSDKSSNSKKWAGGNDSNKSDSDESDEST